MLWALSLWTGLAFLFRHDHGAYIGVTAARDDRDRARARSHRRWRASLVHFGVPIVVLLIPFLVFLQVNGGLPFYLRSTLDTARGEYARTAGQISVLPPGVDRRAAACRRRPRPARPIPM